LIFSRTAVDVERVRTFSELWDFIEEMNKATGLAIER